MITILKQLDNLVKKTGIKYRLIIKKYVIIIVLEKRRVYFLKTDRDGKSNYRTAIKYLVGMYKGIASAVVA